MASLKYEVFICRFLSGHNSKSQTTNSHQNDRMKLGLGLSCSSGYEGDDNKPEAEVITSNTELISSLEPAVKHFAPNLAASSHGVELESSQVRHLK